MLTVALAATLACGKSRPFADDVAPLQPTNDLGVRDGGAALPGNPGAPGCSSNGCAAPFVDCLNDADCSGATDQCNLATARCVECLDDSGCTGGEVCDVEKHACVGCLTTAQCLDAFNARCQTDPARPETLAYLRRLHRNSGIRALRRASSLGGALGAVGSTRCHSCSDYGAR